MTDFQSKLELQQTPDGSYTLLRTDIGETYHSRHGALTESLHVFIKNGLELLPNKDKIMVLEIGLGTMLNAYLTAQWAQEQGQHIDYIGLEKHPVPAEFLVKPDIKWDLNGEQYGQITKTPWEAPSQINDYFSFQKQVADALTCEINMAPDIIFFDAFAPNYQGEMWDITFFGKLFKTIKPGGIFTTYCAKGSVRRDLEAVGFRIERKPGPPGKREMLVGFKD